MIAAKVTLLQIFICIKVGFQSINQSIFSRLADKEEELLAGFAYMIIIFQAIALHHALLVKILAITNNQETKIIVHIISVLGQNLMTPHSEQTIECFFCRNLRKSGSNILCP